ncbi:low temperature requirement protein A [Streptomyces sp. KR55]|uniref:low temperature requirement protein A n=1 Tax=Streptomyces sp. KR55 TaxID=3457425 RepID=UPI003FD0D013
MRWLYFARPAHTLLATTHRGPGRRFRWAYGHYLIFASAAAVGAGLAVNADRVTHRANITPQAAGAMVVVPAAVFLATVRALHLRPHHRRTAEGGALPPYDRPDPPGRPLPAPALTTGSCWRCWPLWSPGGAAGGVRSVEGRGRFGGCVGGG